MFWRLFWCAMLLGCLFFSYLFYAGVRDTVAYAGLPQAGPIPPGAGEPVGSQAGAPIVTPRPSPAARTAPRTDVNILLLGIDERADETGPWRTDTMILCSLDPAKKSVSMLSIPRDLWVPLPPELAYSREDRVNTAHFYGDLYGYPGGGPALAKATVEYNLGVPVDYYVRLNFSGFEKVIDQIGGIDVDVPRAIVDGKYPVVGDEVMTLTIQAGLQHMDGDLALKYARTRHDSSDIDRAHRQQQVIMAVRDRVLRGDVPLTRLPGLVQALGASLSTDLPLDKLLTLAQAARQVQAGDIRQGVIDGTMTIPWETQDGAQVLLPDRPKIGALIEQLFPVE